MVQESKDNLPLWKKGLNKAIIESIRVEAKSIRLVSAEIPIESEEISVLAKPKNETSQLCFLLRLET